MKKPQDQSFLTSHFFVRKVFWDRGGGHSQPMVLLGILKETRERSGGMERERDGRPARSPIPAASLLTCCRWWSLYNFVSG